MKKVFFIFSVFTMVLPAFAEPVAGTPTHANPAVFAKDGNNNTIQPGYALTNSDSTDINVATAGYVKGAYNTAIKAVNTVADSIPTSEPQTAASGRVGVWVE